jgi:hypothetical protein
VAVAAVTQRVGLAQLLVGLPTGLLKTRLIWSLRSSYFHCCTIYLPVEAVAAVVVVGRWIELAGLDWILLPGFPMIYLISIPTNSFRCCAISLRQVAVTRWIGLAGLAGIFLAEFSTIRLVWSQKSSYFHCEGILLRVAAPGRWFELAELDWTVLPGFAMIHLIWIPKSNFHCCTIRLPAVGVVAAHWIGPAEMAGIFLLVLRVAAPGRWFELAELDWTVLSGFAMIHLIWIPKSNFQCCTIRLPAVGVVVAHWIGPAELAGIFLLLEFSTIRLIWSQKSSYFHCEVSRLQVVVVVVVVEAAHWIELAGMAVFFLSAFLTIHLT